MIVPLDIEFPKFFTYDYNTIELHFSENEIEIVSSIYDTNLFSLFL